MTENKTVVVHKTGCGTWILAAILVILLIFLGPCLLPACLVIL
jgi:Sec-independent protein translocase protein TatA